MKDWVYLVASKIILAPVFICAMCDNFALVFIGLAYGLFLGALSHRPKVRKFIVRTYRAQLRLFSGRLVCEL